MPAASLPCLLHFCSLLLYQKQFIARTVAHGMLKTQVSIYIYIYIYISILVMDFAPLDNL